MRNHLLYLLLRVGAWLVVRIPLSVAYALASIAGTLAFYIARPARRGIEANLGLALPAVPPAVRRRIAAAAFRHNAMNWVDTLRIPSLDADAVDSLVNVDRWDVIQQAVGAGKGVIMVMFHVGNYDLVGQYLVAHDVPFSIPVERIEPKRLHRFLVERREARGITILPIEDASRALLRALRRGEVIGIAADRGVAGKGVDVELFGRRLELPRGPAALARRTGAPLIVGVGIRRRGRSFAGFVVPVDVPHTDNAHADEEVATQRLATVVESFVRAYPGQWLAFSPIEEKRNTGVNDPATISQQNEAAR